MIREVLPLEAYQDLNASGVEQGPCVTEKRKGQENERLLLVLRKEGSQRRLRASLALRG
jgi:hypothetical protein